MRTRPGGAPPYPETRDASVSGIRWAPKSAGAIGAHSQRRTPSLARFLARYGSHISLVLPPYDTVTSLVGPAQEPPLGAIAVGAGDDLLVVASGLSLVVRQWPWVIPCIALTSGQWQFEELLSLFPRLSARLAFARLEAHSGATLRNALAAVRARRFPSARLLSRWVCQRISAPHHYSVILAQFMQALHGTPAARVLSVATSSRRLGQLGHYTARDWRTLASMSADMNSCGSGAGWHMLRQRSARHVRKYLSVSVKTAATLLGWEWILEQALRAGGYVGARDPKGP